MPPIMPRRLGHVGPLEPVELHDAVEQAIALVDIVAQSLRQLVIAGATPLGRRGRELDLLLFGAGILAADFAFVDGSLQQQPRGKLHEPGGEAHGFGGVEEAGFAAEAAAFRAAGRIEIGRNLLDQAHAFPVERIEPAGRDDARTDGDGRSDFVELGHAAS